MSYLFARGQGLGEHPQHVAVGQQRQPPRASAVAVAVAVAVAITLCALLAPCPLLARFARLALLGACRLLALALALAAQEQRLEERGGGGLLGAVRAAVRAVPAVHAALDVARNDLRAQPHHLAVSK